MSNTEEMVLRESPKFIQFSAGDVVEGILVGISAQMISGKRALKYTVEQSDGSRASFLGTYQINEQLRPTDIGHKIQVTYVGEDTGVVRNGNAMRVFEVRVGTKKALEYASPASFGITDDDIPF